MYKVVPLTAAIPASSPKTSQCDDALLVMASGSDSIWVGGLFCKGAKAGDLAAFAQKVPKVRVCRQALENNRRERIRTCTMKVLDHMLQNPNSSVDIWASLESNLIVLDESKLVESAGNFGGPPSLVLNKTTFGKLGSDKKAMVYINLPDGPSVDLLNKIDDKDPRALHDMFVMHFQLQKSDKIPDEMQDPTIFLAVCRDRHIEVGSRAKDWFEKSVSEDGVVDWLAAPLYSLGWKDGLLATVLHISGVSIDVPSHCMINDKFCLVDPFSDDLARFTYGASTHYVKDWFGRDEGPHKHRLDKAGKHMKDMAAAAAKAIHTKKLEVKAVLGSASNVKLDARQKRVREEALDKARAVMANNRKSVVRWP